MFPVGFQHHSSLPPPQKPRARFTAWLLALLFKTVFHAAPQAFLSLRNTHQVSRSAARIARHKPETMGHSASFSPHHRTGCENGKGQGPCLTHPYMEHLSPLAVETPLLPFFLLLHSRQQS